MSLPAQSENTTPFPGAKVFSASAASGVGATLRDIADGFAMGPVWRAFAWDEIQQRYRRSAIGVAWIVISYLLFVVAISLFFGGFSALKSGSFTAYSAIGYAAFTFLVGNVTDGCAVFSTSSTWIKSSALPYSIYVYKSIARSLFPFALQLLASLAVIIFTGWRPHWEALLVLPALAIYLVNAVWIQLLFGLVSARWRDFAHLVAAVTRVLFFMTPILWVYEERTGLVRRIADLNPFTHFLKIFRAPLLDLPISAFSWYSVIAWTIGGWAVTLIASSVMRRRLPFWV